MARSIGNAVRKSARQVLGFSDARFLIVDAKHTRHGWGDTSRSGLPIYPWTFRHGTVDLRTGPPDEILRHEIGHDLLERYIVANTRSGQYGTDAPDWLDESVAVAFEAGEEKAGRRCEASRLSKEGALLPVNRYLTMIHPDLAGTPRAAPTKPQGFSMTTSVSQDTPAFYAMSIAFPEYLVAKTGMASVLGKLARGVNKEVPLERMAFAMAMGANRRFDPEELNRDFLSWLASDGRYQCGG
jgi:hypothetical protein